MGFDPRFLRLYPDKESCLEYLWRAHYAPDGIHAWCPKCKQERAFRRYALKRSGFTCLGCGRHVHPTAGTVFHKVQNLHHWFYAMWLLKSNPDISAAELRRRVGVEYGVARRMKAYYPHWNNE